MKDFCDINCLKSLIKEPTCFKNPDKPMCIDLILTNRPKTVTAALLKQASQTFLKITTFKMGFQKLKPKIIPYQ